MLDELLQDMLSRSQSTQIVSKTAEESVNSALRDVNQLIGDQKIQDSISNRNQRESFTHSILVMMAYEVGFIFVLLATVFTVPFINALAPKIQLNTPPLFLSISIVVLSFAIYKFVNRINDFDIRIFKLKVQTCAIKKIIKILCIAAPIIVINLLHRKSLIINFQDITLSHSIINIILCASISVFVKTTVLAGMIIKGLYDVLKRD